MKCPIVILALAAVASALAIIIGCSSATQTAINGDAVVIPSVNAAMTAWAAKVNSGDVLATEVASVSNAYSIYYQSQLVASNLASAYASNPTTNLQTAAENAVQAAVASQTNLVQLINLLSK